MYLDALDLTTPATRGGAQPSAGTALDRLKELFYRALADFRARRYRRAIITWERIRHLPGAPANVVAACLFNIGAANLRLRRFATAVIYFETYVGRTGISDRDRTDAQRRLNAAKRRIGIATP
jgi:hypothetical protein